MFFCQRYTIFFVEILSWEQAYILSTATLSHRVHPQEAAYNQLMVNVWRSLWVITLYLMACYTKGKLIVVI